VGGDEERKKITMKPHMIERYSFLWSEARLVIASVALFIGGVPLLRAILPFGLFFGLVSFLLTGAWLISGLVSCYQIYRWITGNKTVFGGKVPLDTTAFWISAISGINLGLAGLSGRNLGMQIFPSYFFFFIAGLIYLATAFHLWKRWKASGEKMFEQKTLQEQQPAPAQQ
jgi:hypothetical protein